MADEAETTGDGASAAAVTTVDAAAAAAVLEQVAGGGGVGEMTPAQLQAMMQQMQLAQQAGGKGSGSGSGYQPASKDPAKARDKEYKFWKTQPVPQFSEDGGGKGKGKGAAKGSGGEAYGAIEPDNENVRQEPYALPAGYEWVTMDLEDSTQLDDLYRLLNENYVEDDDNMFRFDYSRDFLRWALQAPGWKQQWHAGVRTATGKQKLVGFISGIPAHLRMRKHSQVLVEINFLCVHKKLRSKRLAPVLIQEITRRVHVEGIFQAVYTAGVVLPKPVARCRYWHRSLNPKKLIETRFSHLRRNMTMARTIKLYKVAAEPKTPGIRAMTEADVKQAHPLLVRYLARFDIAPVFDEDEFRHWFLPRDGVVHSFVVENPKSKKITDMCSFYGLPSTVMNHPQYKEIRAAYSFYNPHTATPLKQLMEDALILAKNVGFDVFNALDLMENSTFLTDLKFGEGDGCLNYYLYNYYAGEVAAHKMGLVLL